MIFTGKEKTGDAMGLCISTPDATMNLSMSRAANGIYWLGECMGRGDIEQIINGFENILLELKKLQTHELSIIETYNQRYNVANK